MKKEKECITPVRLLAALTILSFGLEAMAQTADGQTDLFSMSLEQLMDVEITTSARRPQSISRATHAVYVITAEDIRNAGPVRIEELLRLVPGVDVFQTEGLATSVGARGYVKWNNERMQLLLDGRPLWVSHVHAPDKTQRTDELANGRNGNYPEPQAQGRTDQPF